MDFSESAFCPPANPSLPSVSHARLTHEYQDTCRQLETLSQYSPSPEISRDRLVLLYNRATVLYELGNFQESLRDLNRAISSSSEADSDILNLRSLVYSALGSFDLSLQDINQAIHLSVDIRPFSSSAGDSLSDSGHIYYNTRGVLLHSLGNDQTADGDLSEAISRSWMDPSSTAKYLNHRGIVRMKLEKWVGSLDDFEAAIRLDPTLVVAYVNRARLRLLVSLDDADEVLRSRFRRGSESLLEGAERDLVFAREILGCQRWIVWSNLGVVKLLKCEPAVAVSCFRKALESGGGGGGWNDDKESEMLVRYRLAIALKYEGNFEEARDECLRVLDAVQDPSKIVPKAIRAVGSGSRCERILDDMVAGPRENLKRLQAVICRDIPPTAVRPNDRTTASIARSNVVPTPNPRDKTIAPVPTPVFRLGGRCKSPETIPSQPLDVDVRPCLPVMPRRCLPSASQELNPEQATCSLSCLAGRTTATEDDEEESRKRKRLVPTAREFVPSKRRKIVDLVTGGTKAVPSPRNDDAE